MNKTINLKGSLTGFFLVMATLNVAAQKINEQELKVNVADISSATSKLMSIKPVTFEYDLKKYNNLKFPAGTQYGFMADKLKPEFPDLVNEQAKSYSAGKNAVKIAKYDEVQNEKLIPVLVAALQEQQEMIISLKKEMEDMKAAGQK